MYKKTIQTCLLGFAMFEFKHHSLSDFSSSQEIAISIKRCLNSNIYLVHFLSKLRYFHAKDKLEFLSDFSSRNCNFHQKMFEFKHLFCPFSVIVKIFSCQRQVRISIRFFIKKLEISSKDV